MSRKAPDNGSARDRQALDGEGTGKEELKDTDWHEFPIEGEGLMSEDGVELVAGHDDRYYYPGKNGWPDYERGAVDPDTLEPIAGPSGPASDE